ncbi:Protein SET DOMAIN GROUP 41 [Quillaja saponaria]|uniref:Protein SET DOMAIN GROUP 41 n=1 Tax=Quillaja saponaria TaxID=32244 RepID=A0AAD7PVX1_QUISA|nr:Protein SET DOMAIN GROUP 41 [Quillaja saponaria]
MEMEMEMEMRAMEDIDIGQDITPPIQPLSFSLHDSLLHSHCSACFSPLPSPPNHFPPLLSTFSYTSHQVPTLFYCSHQCSFSDSSLHVSSAEYNLLRLLESHPSDISFLGDDTSDLRAALRFLQSHQAAWQSGRTDRIAGLLTNRDKVMTLENSDDDFFAKIRFGSRVIAAARKMRDGGKVVSWDVNDDTVMEEEEAALCLVLTNAVEVQDNTGRTLGIAVYYPTFCWINHSCSPNGCYRFSLSSPRSTPSSASEVNLRLVPSCHAGETRESGLIFSNIELAKEEKQGYGPTVIVRSTKRIRKGEEVTVAYTDLLQPKAMRQLELWSRYHFICCCRRCVVSPLTYVDHVLQEVSAASDLELSSLSSNYMLYRDRVAKRLTHYIDEIISEYLSVGDPESSCEKLESMLTQGLDEKLEGNEGQSCLTFRLHPLHHLSLNAYTILASAYKVRVSKLLSLYIGSAKYQLEASNMRRTSAAYSLLLAGATHHLFHSESSLITSVANFWTSAGVSLLTIATSSGWSEHLSCDLAVTNLSSVANFKCSVCSLMERLKTSSSNYVDFEDVTSKFLDCVANSTPKVWRFLVSGCHFLRLFKDPIDFNWLRTTENSSMWDFQTHCSSSNMGSYYDDEESSVGSGALGSTEHQRVQISQLGAHCLVYGGYLASICYGHPSDLICHVQNILDQIMNEVSYVVLKKHTDK